MFNNTKHTESINGLSAPYLFLAWCFDLVYFMDSQKTVKETTRLNIQSYFVKAYKLYLGLKIHSGLCRVDSTLCYVV